MSVAPVVRYMILCEDWSTDPHNPRRVNILGLLSNIRSVDEPAYPLLLPELCIFLALTEARGQGTAQITCVLEEDGRKIFATPRREVTFPPDPLEVIGVPFRIRDCLFPKAGLYSIQFWYNETMVEQRPLRLR